MDSDTMSIDDLTTMMEASKKNRRNDRRVFLRGRVREPVHLKVIIVPESEYDDRLQFSPRGMQRYYEMLFEYLPVDGFNELASLFHTYHINNLEHKDPHDT